MAGLKRMLGFLALALIPLCAVYAQPVPAKADVQPEPELIRFNVLGTRLANQMYWEIDSNGRGQISVPDIVGHKIARPLANDPEYQIVPGTHSFDIGPEGYRDLRSFLALVIDVKRDPTSELTQGLGCTRALDSGSTEIRWMGQGDGNLMLPNECLTSFGKLFKDRMNHSWFVIAKHMHAAKHEAITVVEPVSLRTPKRLSVTERGIWTPYVIRWEIDEKGKGWIDFSEDLALRGADPLKGPYPVDARRYGFQLDAPFHQAILREFADYLAGSARPGSCEDEVSTSDQPIVKIEWENTERQRSSYQGDLGCPSFAARAGRVKIMFAELLGNGQLGGATLLWGK